MKSGDCASSHQGSRFQESLPSNASSGARFGVSQIHLSNGSRTCLDAGLWQNKEETFGLMPPDGTVYKAFTRSPQQSVGCVHAV